MSEEGRLRPLGELIERVLGRFGLPDAATWERLTRDWEELVGPPWDRQTRPVALRDGVLTVEAVTPAAVSLLKYGLSGVERMLVERLGPAVVREVRIRPPARR